MGEYWVCESAWDTVGGHHREQSYAIAADDVGREVGVAVGRNYQAEIH